jgi:D-glycero-alpha-D-manno-heptose 1-phosphate guanylyltransferase
LVHARREVTDVERPRRGGIFAAGFGSRLQPASGTPKALTIVSGRPLIDWILDELEDARVSEIAIIINEQSLSVRAHVDTERRPCRIRWIVETTPSSMHSFLRIVETLAEDAHDGPFLISTVDTIALPGTFRRFVEAARPVLGADMVLALTSRIEEEKPLKVETRRHPSGAGVQVVGLGAEGAYATAGYYLVRPSILREAAAGRAANLGALRLFFGRLVDCGYSVAGVSMPDSIDVDRPADIGAAELLLGTEPE